MTKYYCHVNFFQLCCSLAGTGPKSPLKSSFPPITRAAHCCRSYLRGDLAKVKMTALSVEAATATPAIPREAATDGPMARGPGQPSTSGRAEGTMSPGVPREESTSSGVHTARGRPSLWAGTAKSKTVLSLILIQSKPFF